MLTPWRQVKPRPKVQNKNIQAEIIDISSGEDEILARILSVPKQTSNHPETVPVDSDEDLSPGKSPVRRLSRLTINSESESDPEFATPGPFEDHLLDSPVTTSHNSVIDLTIDDTDSEDRELCVPRRVNDIRHKVQPLPSKDDLPSASRQSPSSIVDNPYIRENGGILILNEPKSTRKPVVRVTQTKGKSSAFLVGKNDGISFGDPFFCVSDAEDELEGRSIAAAPKTPSRRHKNQPRATRPSRSPSISSDISTPVVATPTKASVKRGTKTPRMTKKALQAAEFERRAKYAQELFNELNIAIFDCGLPASTSLKWSNRLLSTAGRAHYRKSKDGSRTVEIELATKVLDSDERIRNTLSHEMCHLACWVINGEMKEAHGKIFRGWSKRLMRKRPDIVITTKHSYDITHPYEWRCQVCGKVYGRFSKSIRPGRHSCGACQGELVPLFQSRPPRTPKKPLDPYLEKFDINSPIDLTIDPEEYCSARRIQPLEVDDVSAASVQKVQGANSDVDDVILALETATIATSP